MTDIIRTVIDVTANPTSEQIEMLKNAEKMPIVYDEDCPKLTPEQLKKFRRVGRKLVTHTVTSNI